LSVDQVELYEFGKPRVSEHPLYNEFMIVPFCASFYHEGEFVFSRSHLLLLLDPHGHLNWVAGPLATQIESSTSPLSHATPGALFSTLGRGITQIIAQHQPDLTTRMKQCERFPTHYRLLGAVLDDAPMQGMPPRHHEKKEPTRWITT
jgi:hypothetical protein